MPKRGPEASAWLYTFACAWRQREEVVLYGSRVDAVRRPSRARAFIARCGTAVAHARAASLVQRRLF